MGRFHKAYAISGDVNECKNLIERYILSRGYEETSNYYGRRIFVAYDSSMPAILGADNNMRFIDVSLRDELIVVEAWILNAFAVAGDRSWNNPDFITKLDKNEIDPSEERARCKAKKRDMLILLEDIVAITEEYKRSQTVSAFFMLPSGYNYAIKCDNLSDFLKTIGPKSALGCITKQSIFVYVMAFLAAAAAIATSSWFDIAQIVLIVFLTLMIHVRKNPIYSTALFALCLGEILLPFLFVSSSNWVTWFLLVDSYFMMNTFKSVKRMFLHSVRNPHTGGKFSRKSEQN